MTYCCWCKLMLLVDAADIKLRLLEQSAAAVQIVSVVQIVKTVSIRVNTVMYKLRLPQVVSTAKLPILNPNEFDLWKIRIEQYFLMTDYSLWEVIHNGDSPILTRVIKGVVQPVTPTNAEQRQLRNGLTKKVQKTLLKQQYENFTGSSSESLDQIHDRLQKLISQLEILRESLSQEDINLKFLRSLPTKWRTHTLISRNKTDLEDQSLDDLFNSLKINEAEVKISVVASVYAASVKVPVFALPNMDTLSDAVIYSFMVMLTMRARRFLQKIGRNLGANGTTSIGFDMSKVECTTTTREGTLQESAGLESVEARILVYQQNETVFEKDIKLLKLDVELRDNALVALRRKFKKSEQERDEVRLKLEKFQTSSKNLSQILASQTNEKTRLGYDNQVFPSSMFDCDDMFSFKSDVRTFIPLKPDLVHDAPTINETVHTAFNVELSPTKPDKDLSHTHRPSAPIIEDWISDSEDDSGAKTTQNVPGFVQPPEHVKTPRPSIKPAEHPILATNLRKDNPKSRGHSQIRNKKTCFVCKSLTHLIKDCDYYEKKMVQTPARNYAQRENHQHYAIITHLNPQRHVVPTAVLTRSKLVPLTTARPVTTVVPQPHMTRPRPVKTRNTQHALKDKGVIDSGCSRHMTGNMSYLSVFEEINGGYVAFGGNPKGRNITGKFDGKTDEGFLVGYSNIDDDDATFEVKKPKSEVHVSSRNSAKTKKHDGKTKKEAKGKSHVELSTRFRNLNEELEDFSDNSINEVNAASTLVTAVRNKKDERGIVVRNKARLVAQGHTQEEGINYEEVFALVARIEAIRLFLAYASFIGFMVYQMDVKSDFLYGTIEEEVYVCQPLGIEDPDYPNMVYKVVKALYGLHQAPRAWYETLANYLLENVKQKLDGIFISHDKYVAKILRMFGLTDGKSASTPIDTEKPLLKDLDVCAYAHFQVTPKASHLHAVKRIFRYLKCKPHLGLWYPKDSPFNLVAYSDSDYAGASLDRKSTTGGCQFLGCRLISWQCKKQTVVATSSTEAEYVAAVSCYAQVLWIQNQLLDYGYNFMHTTIYIDNSSTIDASEGFDRIIDFLNASSIQVGTDRYEKPSTKLTFYKAFFLVQWKFLIDIILQCMSAKRTSWNEFSSSMASAVICLATGRKFNFLKYIFDSLVQNVDISSKFYMYPRFLQLIICAQVGDLSSHTTKYSSLALTQKQASADVADVVADDVAANDVPAADDEPTPPSPPPTTTPPPPQELPSTSQVMTTPHPSPIAQPSSPLQQQLPLQPTTISMDLLNHLLETCTALTRRVKNLEQDKIAQALEITKLKQRILLWMIRRMHPNRGIIELIDADKDGTLEEVDVTKDTKVEKNVELMTEVVTAATTTITTAPITAATITAAPSAARKGKGVVIRDLEETATPLTIIHSEPKSKDKGKRIMVEEPKPLKKQAQIEQDEAYARDVEISGIEEEATDRSPGQKEYDEQLEEEESKALKRTSKSLEEKAAKKQKLDDEVEELKKHLQIMPNDDDDVYTEATPLSFKVPVVDYEIYTENNKPYYKIIRADGSH
uniref:Reverse transcriptase Ty1/copia-type domain-containing protein n=1 Tax=Tanacetum cinerariifolium TaxID=118510 RepID=A0A6L2NMM8_TANCI|nr:hypothetical protein [Tanacetum cinerariifolium]